MESQVNVLGRGSEIQRAIKMYGRIGGDFESRVTKTGFRRDPSQGIKERSLVGLFLDDMLGTTEGLLEDVFMLPPSVVRRTFNFINAHKFLLVLLFFSMILNMFLSGRSTVEYWHQRHAEQVIRKAGVQANQAIIRMVSLKNIP